MKPYLLLFAFLLSSMPVFGQLTFGGASGDGDNEQTTITADAMDINLAKNKILLLGKVHVVNTKLDLRCRRMILFLIPKDAPAAKQTAKKGEVEKKTEGGKDLDRIECYEEVVIIRREKSDDGSEQKSESGKAVYRYADSSLTLTEKPVLHKGDQSTVYGTKIILYLNSDRMELFDGKVVTSELGSMKNR